MYDTTEMEAVARTCLERLKTGRYNLKQMSREIGISAITVYTFTRGEKVKFDTVMKIKAYLDSFSRVG